MERQCLEQGRHRRQPCYADCLRFLVVPVTVTGSSDDGPFFSSSSSVSYFYLDISGKGKQEGGIELIPMERICQVPDRLWSANKVLQRGGLPHASSPRASTSESTQTQSTQTAKRCRKKSWRSDFISLNGGWWQEWEKGGRTLFRPAFGSRVSCLRSGLTEDLGLLSSSLPEGMGLDLVCGIQCSPHRTNPLMHLVT